MPAVHDPHTIQLLKRSEALLERSRELQAGAQLLSRRVLYLLSLPVQHLDAPRRRDSKTLAA
jgi:hypothetical protein